MKKKKQVVICCPTYENMTEQDKKEIYNLLEFKKRLKEWRENEQKRHQSDSKGSEKNKEILKKLLTNK